jgi:excisionase family DNA binding protein
METPTDSDALAYRPAQAASVLGISVSRLYELLASRQLHARKPSSRVTLIPRSELERFLDSLPDARQSSG